MSRQRQTRRTVFRTIGGGFGLGTLGVGHASAGPDELSQQLRDVRATTRAYKDIGEARTDGDAAITPYVPGMGFHFADESLFGTELTDPGVLVSFTNGSHNPAPRDPHTPIMTTT